MIIFLEDVGCVALWPRVDALVGRWVGAAGRRAEALAVHEITAVLCAPPKSRACSHARAVAAAADHDAGALATARALYPDIAALLAEVARDPRRAAPCEPMWKGALVEALGARSRAAVVWAWIIQERGFPRPAPGGRKAVWTIFAALEEGCDPALAEMVPLARRWYKDLKNTREAFLCWMLPLLAQVDRHDLAPPDIPYAPPADPLADAGGRDLDAFVYDIHVGGAGGLRKGCGGLVRFAEEGSHVVNESAVVDPVWRAFYNDCKRVAEFVEPIGPPPEPTAPEPTAPEPTAPEPTAPEPTAPAEFAGVARETQFEFLVRAQINTGHGKTDVYFARAPGDPSRVVVVKGPFATEDPPRKAIEMNEWKQQNGLPHCRMAAVQMLPDRWPEGVPMGIRNRIARGRPAWFLVADSLLPGAPPVRDHGPTAKWPVTAVVDWASLGAHAWAPSAAPTRQERVDYILAVLARFALGVGDAADRNFVRAGGRLYSLDEDTRSSNPWPHPYSELRKTRAALVLEWLGEVGPEVVAATRAWRAPENHDDSLARRLRATQEPDTLRSLFAPMLAGGSDEAGPSAPRG